MLHQMLISPFISFHPSSSSPSSLSLPYSHSSQVEKDKIMEHESGNEFQLEQEQELAWFVEKGNNIFGEEFVDEFLDLGGLTETEKELDDDDEEKENGEKEKKETAEEEEEEEDNSAVSFEPSPPPPVSEPSPPLPVSELAFPAHDVAELEWVSRLMDDSLSEFPPCSVAAAVPPLDNTKMSVVPVPPGVEVEVEVEVEVRAKAKAKRSKRNRSPSGSWSNWGPPDYYTSSSSSSSSTTTTTIRTPSSSCPSPSYSSSSPLIFFTPLTDMCLPSKKQKIPKKRGRKPKPRPPVAPSGGGGGGEEEGKGQYYQNQFSSLSLERRCSHCGVNKTPQWRAGPMGAKTLCNACGVRYKSGRLLPEYRPACSPTFVSHVHSNSHRKVLEMRRKKESMEQNENDHDNHSLIQVCSVSSF